jgi:hypothetical protein
VVDGASAAADGSDAVVAVDIALVVVIVAAVVGGITAVSANRAQQKALTAGRPDRRLPQAARLLDKVVAADDVLPSLPTVLVKEIKAFLTRYYADK